MLQRCHAERRLHGGAGLYEKGDWGNIPKEKTGNVLICCKTWRLPLAGWKLYWGCSSPLPFPVPREEEGAVERFHLAPHPVPGGEKQRRRITDSNEKIEITWRRVRLSYCSGTLGRRISETGASQCLTCHSLSLLLRNWCTTSTKVAGVWYIR